MLLHCWQTPMPPIVRRRHWYYGRQHWGTSRSHQQTRRQSKGIWNRSQHRKELSHDQQHEQRQCRCLHERQPLQNHPSGHFWGRETSWLAEEMLDGQHQRVDIPAHARTAHINDLQQKTLEENLCCHVSPPHPPDDPFGQGDELNCFSCVWLLTNMRAFNTKQIFLLTHAHGFAYLHATFTYGFVTGRIHTKNRLPDENSQGLLYRTDVRVWRTTV